jgi:hypothetical protein
MVSTPRIERLTANRAARFAMRVLANGQLCAAGSAKYRLLVPFALWPNVDLVIGQSRVAIFARIVNPAALHLDRDDVRGPVVMCTTGLRIEIDTAHGRRIPRHCAHQRTRTFSQWSAALHRIRRSAALDPRNESPVSNAAVGLQHPASASGCDSWGGHRE